VKPPSADDIAELAERAFAAIPVRLAEHVRGVGITVEELPDDETLDDLGIGSAWELTGLYRWHAADRAQRQRRHARAGPDLSSTASRSCWSGSRRTSICIIWSATCCVHEIAHHFGFSDAAIEALEREME